MKKRRRKLNACEQASSVLSFSAIDNISVNINSRRIQKQFTLLAAIVLALLTSVLVSCAKQHAATAIQHHQFDSEEFKLPPSNRSASERAGEAKGEGEFRTQHAHQIHQKGGSQLFNLFGASQRNQISTEPTEPQVIRPANVGSSSREPLAPSAASEQGSLQAAGGHLEDLLAVEATRLLTIGRQTGDSGSSAAATAAQAAADKPAPPYASQPSNQSLSNGSDHDRLRSSERQFVKLFLPPQPVFVPQSFGASSSGAGGSSANVRQHNIFQPPQQVAFPIPISSIPIWQQRPAPSSGGGGGGSLTSRTTPIFGGRPAPPTWSSSAPPPHPDLLGPSSGQTSARPAEWAPSAKPNFERNWEQQELNGSATVGVEETPPKDSSGANSLRVMNNLADQQHQQQQEGKQFPSLLSSESPNGEDQFEQIVSHQNASKWTSEQAGGAQRATNSSKTDWSQLLRQATESNVMESLMVTNRSMVSLLCDTNDMLLRLKFRQPFNGIVMTNLDRRRACRLVGNGSRYYEMQVPLRGDCGTRQEMPRLFINNIQIQFRPPPEAAGDAAAAAAPNLPFEVVDDEVKTIICSYPIRPRAPPPPTGLPERIIELLGNGSSGGGGGGGGQSFNLGQPPKLRLDDRQQAPAAAAKLVYYEPLLLISGFLLLALALLGLATSAYVFRRRRRDGAKPKRSASSASFSSARLYRNSPAQMANRQLAKPPSIGRLATEQSTDEEANLGLASPSLAGRAGQSKRAGQLSSWTSYQFKANRPAHRWRTLSANARVAIDEAAKANDDGQPLAVGRQRIVASSLPKSALKRESPAGNNVSVVNLTANSNNKAAAYSDSADSLATKGHDRASVTTIEIPYARPGERPSVPKKSQALIRRFTPADKSKSSALGKNEAPPPTRRLSEDQSGRRLHAQQQQQQLPRFGSLRATLTSPDEFKRLQEISKLFDEILIEKHVDQGKEGTIVVYNSRLIPSKYKGKIMDRMSEQERRLAYSILSKDELFRSLVVESTNWETFRRKLRNNPVYADKFSPEAWQLLEEILLDAELSSGSESSSSSSSSSSSPPHQATEESSSSVSAASSYSSITARPPAPPPPPPPPPPVARVDQRQIRSIIHATKVGESKKGERADGSVANDNESIVAEFDTRQHELPNRQDSLNSPTSTNSSISTETKRTTGQLLVQEKSLTEISRQQTSGRQHDQPEPILRVSQFNSTRMSRQVAGLAGTLINIDSVTNFTSSEDFSTYTKSRIEHRQYQSARQDDRQQQQQTDDSLPFVDEDDRVGSYEYSKETFKLSPKLGSNQLTTNRRLFLKRHTPTPTKPTINNNNNNNNNITNNNNNNNTTTNQFLQRINR